MPVRSVLLVDDDPDIRTIGRIALADVGGFDTRVAASGAEALALCAEQAPDVVLLDVMMPELDGPETLRMLRESPGGSAVPVVFLTAKVQKAEVERYLALGAVGVVPKPFDPITLSDQVRALLADG